MNGKAIHHAVVLGAGLEAERRHGAANVNKKLLLSSTIRSKNMVER
jgi:hypothetical protein